MDRRKLLIVLIFSVFAFNAAAQDSFSDLVGSDLTVEESLVQFVNSVTTFEVEGAPGVLLYVVTPLIGFYFLTLNFVSMGYELFEERVDRPAWNHRDEDIPTGMRGFSMIVSVITVLFLGTAGAGLLLFAGLGSLALAVLMMTGLLNEGLGDGGGQQQQNQQTQQNQQQPQQQQGGGGGNWADMFNAAANLFGTAQNTAQGLQQQQQQQTANQMQESLRLFQNDIVSEIERVRSGHSNVENLINQLENELTDPNDFDPDTFKNTLQRANKVDSFLKEMRNKIASDLNGNPNPNFPGSNLANFLSANPDRNPDEEVSGLEGQLERILSGTPSNPPADAFNDLLDEIQYVVAVGHFMHYCPLSMSQIAADPSKAEDVVNAASSMNKIQSRPDNVNKIQQLAGWLDARGNIPANLIEDAERLCKKEMSVNQTEVQAIKALVGEDEDIHKRLKDIDRDISNYSNIPTYLEDNVQNAESKIKDVDNMLASLESQVATTQEYESNVYKKLEELKGKI